MQGWRSGLWRGASAPSLTGSSGGPPSRAICSLGASHVQGLVESQPVSNKDDGVGEAGCHPHRHLVCSSAHGEGDPHTQVVLDVPMDALQPDSTSQRTASLPDQGLSAAGIHEGLEVFPPLQSPGRSPAHQRPSGFGSRRHRLPKGALHCRCPKRTQVKQGSPAAHSLGIGGVRAIPVDLWGRLAHFPCPPFTDPLIALGVDQVPSVPRWLSFGWGSASL